MIEEDSFCFTNSSTPLGQAIPLDPHAVSVSLPTWEDIYGYENHDLRVWGALNTGYPRFVPSKQEQKLWQLAQKTFFPQGEKLVRLYIEKEEVLALEKYIMSQCSLLHPLDLFYWKEKKLFGVGVHREDAPALLPWIKKFNQHTGSIISSRMANHLLAEDEFLPRGKDVLETLRNRLSEPLGLPPSFAHLFRCGMNALYWVFRWALDQFPGKKILQMGFSYLDTLHLPKIFGAQQVFFQKCTEISFQHLESLMEKKEVAGVWCEFPSNPLLQTLDLVRLREVTHKHGVPLFLDDSISSFANLEVKDLADGWVSSLTKIFSGLGNVMGGSLICNPHTLWGKSLQEYLSKKIFFPGFYEDLAILEQNSRTWLTRVEKVNENALKILDFFSTHPQIEAIYYPEINEGNRKVFRRGEQSRGGLMSFLVKGGEEGAKAFYDSVDIPKGPGFGTEFPLICPYTLIAHFQEMDWARAHGLPPYLLRLWVGTVEGNELIGKLEQGLKATLNAQKGAQ